IRSPIMQETSNDFVCELVKWIKENGICKVVILTGVFDYTSFGPEIGVGALKLIVPSTVPEECDQLEQVASSVNHVSVVRWNNNDKIKIHGGGISKRLFTQCISKGISAVFSDEVLF
ncbi:hypothetical protein L9F63_007918, partial [Diploptera punctata]